MHIGDPAGAEHEQNETYCEHVFPSSSIHRLMASSAASANAFRTASLIVLIFILLSLSRYEAFAERHAFAKS